MLSDIENIDMATTFSRYCVTDSYSGIKNLVWKSTFSSYIFLFCFINVSIVMDLTTIIDPCYPSNIYRTLDKFVLLRVMELGFSKKFRETQYWSFLLNFESKNLEYAF